MAEGPLHDTRKLLRPLDYLATVLFLVVWLVPITIVGLTAKPITPQIHLMWLQHVGCLFIVKHPTFQTFTLEALPTCTPATPSPTDWADLGNDPDYAPMAPFGERSRLGWRIEDIDRFSRAYAPGSPPWTRAEMQQQELFDWARARYEKLNPERPGLRAMRLVGARYVVERDLRNPTGGWVRTDFAKIPRERKSLIGMVTYEQDED